MCRFKEILFGYFDVLDYTAEACKWSIQYFVEFLINLSLSIVGAAIMKGWENG